MFTVMRYKGIGSIDWAVFKTIELVNAKIPFDQDYVPKGVVIPVVSGLTKKQADKKCSSMCSKVASKL